MIKWWYILLRWLRLLKKLTFANIFYILIMGCFFTFIPLLTLIKCHQFGRRIFFYIFRRYYLLFPHKQYEDGINEELMMLGLQQIPDEYQQDHNPQDILDGWINNMLELISLFVPLYYYANINDFIQQYRDKLSNILDDKDNLIITMTHSASSIFFAGAYIVYHNKIKKQPRKYYMLFNNTKSWRFRSVRWILKWNKLDVIMFAISDNSITTFKQLIRDMRTSDGQKNHCIYHA